MRANQVYINTESIDDYATATDQTISPGAGNLNTQAEKCKVKINVNYPPNYKLLNFIALLSSITSIFEFCLY